MPFKSEKQRKWMHANEPEMAKDWERKKKKSGAVNESSYTQRSILDFIKANKGAVESDPANIPRIKLFGPKQDSKYLNMSLIGLAKIAKIVKSESVNEAVKPRKGDYIEQFGEIGLVNKASSGYAYVKFPSTNKKSFQRVHMASLKNQR